MRAFALVFLLLASCSKSSFYEMSDQSYMEPAISSGQIVRVKKLASANGSMDVKRFDIVVVGKLPDIEGEHILRILGLPGEKIDFTDDGVLINGEELKTPPWLGYLDERLRGAKVIGSRSIDVPAGECFLIGDNIEVAFDSRYYGPVSLDKIVGIADGKLGN